jgi:hypothetical protein
MQINALPEPDINSAPDAAAPNSAIRDAVQQIEAVVEDPQVNPLSTEIDGYVGLNSSDQWTFETDSAGETGDPLDRAQPGSINNSFGQGCDAAGTDIGATVNSGAALFVNSGGKASATTITSEGVEIVSSGGTGISATLIGLNAVCLHPRTH